MTSDSDRGWGLAAWGADFLSRPWWFWGRRRWARSRSESWQLEWPTAPEEVLIEHGQEVRDRLIPLHLALIRPHLKHASSIVLPLKTPNNDQLQWFWESAPRPSGLEHLALRWGWGRWACSDRRKQSSRGLLQGTYLGCSQDFPSDVSQEVESKLKAQFALE